MDLIILLVPFAIGLFPVLQYAWFYDDVKKLKWMQLLYDAPEMEESKKNTEDIYKEALAIYHLTYEFAKSRDDIGKCKFAWSVAGTALCEVYAWGSAGSKERPFIVLPSVMREILN